MKLTAPVAASERPVEEKHLVRWANDEVMPLLRQMRQALNAILRDRGEVTTDGAGTWANIWTSEPMPATCCWSLEAQVTGMEAGGATQASGHWVYVVVRSEAGVVSSLGVTSKFPSYETVAAIDVQFDLSVADRTVSLQVRDGGASPMKFVAVVRLLEATP